MLSHNNCCRKKTLSFSYSKCVLVALVILRRMNAHL